LGSQRIRNTSPVTDKSHDKRGRPISRSDAEPVRSVGKLAVFLADLIHAAKPLFAPGPVPLSFLGKRTGIDAKHLRHRHLTKVMKDPALVVEVECGYTTPEDVAERVARETRASGCEAKEREQRRKFKDISDAHRAEILALRGVAPDGIAADVGRSVEWVLNVIRPPDRAPTVEEMRERRAVHRPDGEIRQLEKAVPEWTPSSPLRSHSNSYALPGSKHAGRWQRPRRAPSTWCL
jgi:hypothetical protein